MTKSLQEILQEATKMCKSIAEIEKEVQDFIDQKINESQLNDSSATALVTYLGHRLSIMGACMQTNLRTGLSKEKHLLCMRECIKSMHLMKEIIESSND